ncbi:MAG TPA: STAS domain-containing protein [Pyrinomonadaceae bacterium]|jgi:anti-sigma B factor antagonist
MARLNISERRLGDVTVLDLSGDVTFGEGNLLLRAAIRRALAEGKKNIHLNFAEVCYLDSSGVGELVSGYTAISRENGRLKLVDLPPRIYQLLAITKLLTVFEVDESDPKAIEAAGGARQTITK